MTSYAEYLFRLDDTQITMQAVFFELCGDETQRETHSVNRNVQLLQQERNRSDMVLMSMCNDQPADLLIAVDQIIKVRNDFVNTEHVIIREAKSAVDNDNFILVFDGCHVLADFAKSSQRNDFDGSDCLFLLCF